MDERTPQNPLTPVQKMMIALRYISCTDVNSIALKSAPVEYINITEERIKVPQYGSKFMVMSETVCKSTCWLLSNDLRYNWDRNETTPQAIKVLAESRQKWVINSSRSSHSQ